jgi:hypothetical protein
MNTTGEIKIKKDHTLLDLVISSAVFAAGVGLYFVLPGWGILFCLIGVLLFVFYKRANKRVGGSTLLKETSLDVDLEYRDSLKAFLSDGAELPAFELSKEGDHLYFETFHNEEAKVAYAQLFDVADNKFEAVTDIVELRGSRAEKLISKL